MNQHNQEVTGKMIIGAETGGQVYGNGRWNDVKVPKIGLEVTLTLGAYQFYGNEGRELLKMISDAGGLPENMKWFLDFDWVGHQWNPDESVRKAISEIISSQIGIDKQVELFCNIQLPAYIKRAEDFGVYDDFAQMFWVEIEHVGGTKAAKRIFSRCDGDYSIDKIMWSLKQDQNDYSSDNQAGDELYWSRHVFCRKCIEKYGKTDSKKEFDDFDGVYVTIA